MKLFSIEFSAPVTVVVSVALLSSGFALRTDALRFGPSLVAQEPVRPVAPPAARAAAPDGYGPWATDCARKVHACQYTYSTKDGGKGTQTVVIYYADKDRSGWAYYYNTAPTPWARCALPGNPKYDAKAMHWEALKPDADGYERFKGKDGKYQPDGYCPAPKDGKSPIPLLPLPPK